MFHHLIDNFFMYGPGCCQFTVKIHLHAAVFENPVINQGVAGSAVKSGNFTQMPGPCQIGNAADINKNIGLFKILRQSAVISGGNRRTLSAV